MSLFLLVWSMLFLVFVGVPSVYYLYTKRVACRSWELRIDKNYTPSITILVAAHNEEKSIEFKLKNLSKLEYSKEKMEIILINDSSTDKTLQEISNFQTTNPEIPVKVLKNAKRIGKSASLNSALKHATGEVIVVSDADCFWSPDILTKALPYISDPSVGAITGLETLLNPSQSWVTRTETVYNNLAQTIQVGESKIHSTIIFQGGFGAYKRALLNGFDNEADDSGTALEIVQKKARTLLIPEAVYFTMSPPKWLDKIAIKRRRAGQLMRIWIRCLKLLLKGKLVLPKKICLPETFLFIFNPMIFILLVGTTLFLLSNNPVSIVSFAILLPITLIKKTRLLFTEVIQNNLILFVVLFTFIFNRRVSSWKTVGGSRSQLTRDILEKSGLV